MTSFANFGVKNVSEVKMHDCKIKAMKYVWHIKTEEYFVKLGNLRHIKTKEYFVKIGNLQSHCYFVIKVLEYCCLLRRLYN